MSAHFKPCPGLDIGARLDEIRLLKNGWLEGEGKAPPAEGLDWLERACDRHYPDEAVLPHLYPTPEGGIRAEWSNDRWSLSLDIRLADKRGTWHGLDLETDDEEIRDLNLENDGDWTWLIGNLAVIDFTACSNTQVEKKAERLTVAATERGWQYKVDGTS